jgi:hypothetical protein
VLAATPSGVAGAIQFSNGSAFASDAANLFWDDTNNRLGIGTNVPTSKLQIVTDDATNPQVFSNQTSVIAGTASQGSLIGAFSSTNGAFLNALWPGNAWYKMNYGGTNHSFSVGGVLTAVIDSNTTFGNGATTLGARVGIKGSGSTSATTSLLVQNSAGTQTFKVDDSGVTTANILNASSRLQINALDMLDYGSGLRIQYNGSPQRTTLFTNLSGGGMQWYASGSCALGNSTTEVASAVFNTPSTTKGFLPPVMTTTQKNAIASPASGLILYDSTTNKLQCYNGSTWNDLF